MAKFSKDIEEIRECVQAMSKGVAELKKAGLRDSVLRLLVQKSAVRHLPSHQKHKLSTKMVQAVMDGLETFDEYLFPLDTTGD